MPAQNNQTSLSKVNLTHTYREVKQEKIFIDNQDYQVFVNFLKDCLCDTNKIENRKKTFTVRGNTYQGLAYQTQNFFSQIELTAYRLEPYRFDLLVKEIVPGSLEKFIRAISTRYVLYFNKKHNRTGSLFRDPYNLKHVTNPQELAELMHYFHGNFSQKEGVPNHLYSSYPEYLGQRVTEWINLRDSLINDKVNDQKIVESVQKVINTTPVTKLKPKPRFLEIILASSILFFFTSYGLNNITRTTIKNQNSTTTIPFAQPQVSGAKDVKYELSPTPEYSENLTTEGVDTTETPEQNQVKTVVIKITDGKEIVELLKTPTFDSEVIGTAKNGDEFELISVHPQWYEIKLGDGQNGFVPEDYSEIVTKEEKI